MRLQPLLTLLVALITSPIICQATVGSNQNEVQDIVAKKPKTILAIVNNVEITIDDFCREYRNLPDQLKQEVFSAKGRVVLLETIAIRESILAEAALLGIDKSPEVKGESRDLANKVIADAYLAKVINAAPENERDSLWLNLKEKLRQKYNYKANLDEVVKVKVEQCMPSSPVKPLFSKGFKDSITGMEFVPVSAGCFFQGDTFGDGDYIERPAHNICVSNFAIGKYEVTQGQWKKVMGNNPSRFIACGDDCPVENVNWTEVQLFIKRLNDQSCIQYALPTEAEWEYACRSGGKNEKYCGGDNLSSAAWFKRTLERKPILSGKNSQMS